MLWTRIWRGLLAIFWGQVLNTAGTVLLVPVFLSRWSPARYGEWLTLLSLAGYLGTLDLGMGFAAANRLTQAHARGDLVEYRRYQHTALAFACGVAAAGTLLLALGTWLLPVPAFLGIRETPPPQALLTLVLLGLPVLWGLPAGVLVAIYRSTGDYARTQWVLNLENLLSLALLAALLLLGGNLVVVAAGQTILPVLRSGTVLWDVRRRHPELAPGFSRVSWAALRELLLPSLLFASIGPAVALMLQGSVILVSSQLGPLAVAVFVTSRTIGNMIQQAVQALGNALWPQLTILEAQGQTGRLRAMHRLLVGSAMAASVALGAALWFEAPDVFAVWTRRQLEPDMVLLRLLIAYFVLRTPWFASSYVLFAAHRQRTLAFSHIAAAVLGITLSALLMRWLGTWAVPVGLGAAELVACYAFVVREACAVSADDVAAFIRREWAALAAICTAGMAAAWLAHRLAVGPVYLRWGQVGVTTTAVTFLIAWVVALRAPERELVTVRLRPLRLRPHLRLPAGAADAVGGG